MTKQDLLRQHVLGPAINLGSDDEPSIFGGRVGQTHADLMAMRNATGSNIGHGFLMGDGTYKSREQTRTHLNQIAGSPLFGEGEPTSEQLRTSVPIYESPRQRFYSLGGGKAVSIVQDPEGQGLAAAVVNLHYPDRGPGGGFSIDYSGPTPVNGLDEAGAQHFIEEAARHVV